MQSNKEKSIDARTLPQIFSEMSKCEQNELKEALFRATHKTNQSINNWVTGRIVPSDVLTRKAIVKAVNSTICKVTSDVTLLPL